MPTKSCKSWVSFVVVAWSAHQLGIMDPITMMATVYLISLCFINYFASLLFNVLNIFTQKLVNRNFFNMLSWSKPWHQYAYCLLQIIIFTVKIFICQFILFCILICIYFHFSLEIYRSELLLQSICLPNFNIRFLVSYLCRVICNW